MKCLEGLLREFDNGKIPEEAVVTELRTEARIGVNQEKKGRVARQRQELCGRRGQRRS